MTVSTHNLKTLYRGDSREYNLTFTNNEGGAIPITSWKVYFTVKLSYMDDDSKAVIKKDITDHDDPENGKTIIKLLPNDTNIAPGNYYYDIKIKRAENDIRIILIGRVVVEQAITRRID